MSELGTGIAMRVVMDDSVYDVRNISFRFLFALSMPKEEIRLERGRSSPALTVILPSQGYGEGFPAFAGEELRSHHDRHARIAIAGIYHRRAGNGTDIAIRTVNFHIGTIDLQGWEQGVTENEVPPSRACRSLERQDELVIRPPFPHDSDLLGSRARHRRRKPSDEIG